MKLPRWSGFAAAGVAALVPLFARAADMRAAATEGLLLLLAAIGLNLAAGYAGQPSLGQGAFVGVGVYATAILRARAGLGPLAATVVAVLITIIFAAVVARAVAHLRPAFVALVTFLCAWVLAFAIDAFPGLSGGSAGLVVPPANLHSPLLGVRVHIGTVGFYELALLSVIVATVLFTGVLRRYEPAFALVRTDPAIARATGIPVERVRMGAVIAAGAVAGVAGSLIVQSAGVADPVTVAPLLSLKLFLIVVLGGAGTLAGPFAGVLALVLVTRIASLMGGARIEPVITAVLLIAVVASGKGIVPLLNIKPRRGQIRASKQIVQQTPAELVLANATVSFGGVRALEDVALHARGGTCHALIGPNGSGKTTALRVIAGTMRPEGATVMLGETPIAAMDVRARVRAGVVRTFQRTAISPDLTALDHVVAGFEPRRDTHWVRAAVSTPRARTDDTETRAAALAILSETGLGARVDTPAGELTSAEQRTLQIAVALATQPRALLLDEPSAGMDPREEKRLIALIAKLKTRGITIVLVEHNLALVRAVADRVTFLDAGRVVAEGTPQQIENHPEVLAAYLG